jgi:Protein of unknown function (DUF1579)
MKRASTIALAVFMLCAAVASAQNPPMPKPGPEMEKLKYFVGTWKSTGEMKPGMMGPGGKYSATDHNEMELGGFFLVIHSTGNAAGMGNFTSISYLGYNTEEKTYTYHEFNSMGEAGVSKGTVEGDTWTWSSEDKMQGKTVKGRFTINITSPTTYDFKYEASIDGGDFASVVEGKATKVSGGAGQGTGKGSGAGKPSAGTKK